MIGEKSRGQSDSAGSNTIAFGQKYIQSEQFKSLFREGMTLVEDTAAYLDGQGRDESRELSGHVSLAYATESMRLTTRLMQLASWLLVRRAVNEGEMSAEEAFQEKNRVKLRAIGRTGHTMHFEELPEELKQLVHSSFRLYDRIIMLDQLIQSERRENIHVPMSPINGSMEQLRSAFEAQ